MIGRPQPFFGGSTEDVGEGRLPFRSLTSTSLIFDPVIHYATEVPICQDVQNISTMEGIAISAPVPVWYSSLGKDALRSILEMHDRGKANTKGEHTC